MEHTIKIEIDGTIKNSFRSKGDREANEVSPYAVFFDETCPGWLPNSEMNKMFLVQQQNYANELLRAKGYLFLNEAYNIIGAPRTKAGQVVGWIYDENNPIGDNFVDFGIYNIRNRSFVNGYEKSILLDFNVDGCILDLI